MHSFPSKTVLVGLLSSLIRYFHIPAILIDVSTFFRFYRFSYQALRMKSGAVDDVLSKNLHLHFQGRVKRFRLTTNFILIYPRRLRENIFSSFSFMPLCSSFSYIDPSRKLSDTVLLVLWKHSYRSWHDITKALRKRGWKIESLHLETVI